MRRTITIGNFKTVYRRKEYRPIISSLREYFGMTEVARYAVTITEGSKYRFIPLRCSPDVWHIIDLSEVANEKEDGELAGSIGGVCIDVFSRIFFEPDKNKTYDITVKKVKR